MKNWDTDMIDEALKLCQKVSAGPWTCESEKDGSVTLYSGRSKDKHGQNLFGKLVPDWNGSNNLDFICQARINYPEVLKCLKDSLRMNAVLLAQLKKEEQS